MGGIGFGGSVRKRLLDGGGRARGLAFSLAGLVNGPNIGAGDGGPVKRPGSGLRDVQEAFLRAGGWARRPPTGSVDGLVSGPKPGCPVSRALVQDGSLLQRQVWPAGVLPGCGPG